MNQIGVENRTLDGAIKFMQLWHSSGAEELLAGHRLLMALLIARAGEAGITQFELRQQVPAQKSSVSRSLGKMLEDDLIESVVCPVNRSQRILKLRPRCRAILRELYAAKGEVKK
jgi:DNA-binding MarR family transcriptional regulator